MSKIVNPIERIGSLHIRPNWRFELLQNPAKYKMQDFVSTPSSNDSCLKRFLREANLSVEVNYKLPDYLASYLPFLNEEEQKVFIAAWREVFKRSRVKRLSIDTDQNLFTRNPIWNLSKVEQIQDTFLKKLIYHHSNFKSDPYIKYAINLYTSKDHTEIFRFIGYGIYCQLPDQVLAKRWRVAVKHIEAIRKLFFDFSRFPTDRIANFAYLRQLANIGVISDIDFSFFKRAFELGDLGIRAQVDFTSLTNVERRTVEEYLGKTAIANTLNLNFAVKTYKDAAQYGMLVSNLAGYYIKQKEAAYFDSKIRNLDALTRRIEGSMMAEEDGISALDNEMMDLLREHSLKEIPQIEYKTLADLKN